MQWITVNGLIQTVTSTKDTYTVNTAAYDDVTAEFTWTITPSDKSAIMVYHNRVLDKPAIEAMITTFENTPPPPPLSALEGSDSV